MRTKEGKGGGEKPFPPLLGRFQHGAFASKKNICAPEENACTAGYVKQGREKMNTQNNARRNALQLTHRLQINYTRYFDGIVVIFLLLY